MRQDRYTIFSFSCGSFFAGNNTVKLEKIGDRYEATTFEVFADEPTRTFVMSEVDVRKLERQLRSFGIDEWFSRYCNHNVLDGMQWNMEFEDYEYYGSNSFPPNFAKLSKFLAERFACPGVEVEEDLEKDFPDSLDPIAHIAEYYSWMGDPDDKLERKRIASLDEEEPEEECLDLHRTHHQMLRDLDMLVLRRPELTDYRGIIERSGVGLSLAAMKDTELSDLDAITIVAMMIYIYRADRFDGWSDDFLKYIKDGTFKRWLARLAGLIDYPVL